MQTPQRLFLFLFFQKATFRFKFALYAVRSLGMWHIVLYSIELKCLLKSFIELIHIS